MTRLPTESRNVVGVDGQKYELNMYCSAPYCEQPATERHHIFRRSFLIGDYWWVSVAGGDPVPNCTKLCMFCHKDITENRARIVLEFKHFWWINYTEGSPGRKIDPQPGPPAVYSKPEIVDVCPRCKGTGHVPEPVKAVREPLPARKKVVLSIRVPKDSQEDGYEVLTTLIDSCREKLAPDLGWSDTTPPYYVLAVVLADWLNGP